MKPRTANPGGASGAYVGFRLGGEHFAVEAARVREILEPSRLTRVPFAPSYMMGVMNVRGQTTAVMDLGRRFGLPPVEISPETRIMVFDLVHEGERVVVGGVADAVVEVFDLGGGEFAPPPSVAMRWRGECVLGVLRRTGRHLFLLDIPRLLLTEQALPPADDPEDETATMN